MNYYYIDYMVKERQKEVLDACKRRRLLNTVSAPQEGLIRRASNFAVNTFCHIKGPWIFRCRRLYPCFFLAQGFVMKIGRRR
jgi:hypothetical protein